MPFCSCFVPCSLLKLKCHKHLKSELLFQLYGLSHLLNGFYRVAVTKTARKSRRLQLQRWRRETNHTPATVSRRFLCNVSVMHVSKRGFCFSPWKTKTTLLPCMAWSERPHLELKFDNKKLEKFARLNGFLFLFFLFFFFPEMPLRVCSVTSCWPSLTVQMLTSAVWVCY